MKIILTFIIIFFTLESCFFDIFKTEEKLTPLERMTKANPIFTTWFPRPNNDYPGNGSSTCIGSNETLDQNATCINARIVTATSCFERSINKGQVAFFRFQNQSDSNVNLEIKLNRNSTYSSCLLAYKENQMVTYSSSVRNIETNQSLTACQSSTTVSTSSNSFRCFSVYNSCDANFTFRSSSVISPSETQVTSTGIDNSTLPTWSSLAQNYIELNQSPTNLIGNDSLMLLPIGFNFTYFGRTFTTVFANTNGALTFSNRNMSSNDSKLLFQPASQENIHSIIAPWWTDLNMDCDSSLQYQTSGTAPNRIFTVQWKNIGYVATSSTNNFYKFNFQVKLYETSNRIEFHYGNLTGENSSTLPRVALGISNSVGGNNNFINARNGSSTDSSLYLPNIFPTANTVYRFQP